MFDYSIIRQAVIDGDDERTTQLVMAAVAENTPPTDIVKSGLQAGMVFVGRKFSEGDFFIPEMLLAARAVTRAIDALRPRLVNVSDISAGRIVIGTVTGDIHDIGKNLVGMFLEGAGFEVSDLGTDVSPEHFVTAVKEAHPDILGLSALLTTTMPAIASTIRALEQNGLRQQVKVIIGGAPVTQHFADQVGADGYGSDGGVTIEICRQLVGK